MNKKFAFIADIANFNDDIEGISINIEGIVEMDDSVLICKPMISFGAILYNKNMKLINIVIKTGARWIKEFTIPRENNMSEDDAVDILLSHIYDIIVQHASTQSVMFRTCKKYSSEDVLRVYRYYIGENCLPVCEMRLTDESAVILTASFPNRITNIQLSEIDNISDTDNMIQVHVFDEKCNTYTIDRLAYFVVDTSDTENANILCQDYTYSDDIVKSIENAYNFLTKKAILELVVCND